MDRWRKGEFIDKLIDFHGEYDGKNHFTMNYRDLNRRALGGALVMNGL